MRVLQATPAYFPSVGGIESFVEQLALNLNKKRIKKDVLHISTNVCDGVSNRRGFDVITRRLYGYKYFVFVQNLA